MPLPKIKVEPFKKYPGTYLTVIKEIESIWIGKQKKRMFQCICDCGNIIETKLYYLVQRRKKHCGCKRVMLDKKAYSSFQAYKTRYKDIWPKEWRTFQGFIKDMGLNKANLRRFDESLPFSKSNCYWSQHRKNARLLTYKGETKSMAEWARKKKVSRQLIDERLKRMSPEKAIRMRKQKPQRKHEALLKAIRKVNL